MVDFVVVFFVVILSGFCDFDFDLDELHVCVGGFGLDVVGWLDWCFVEFGLVVN